MCYLLVAFVLAAVLCPTYTFADYRYKMRSPNHPPPYHLSKPMPPPPSIHHRIFKHKPIRPPLGLRGPPPSLPHPHPLGPPTFHLGKVPVPPPTFHRTAAPPQLKVYNLYLYKIVFLSYTSRKLNFVACTIYLCSCRN